MVAKIFVGAHFGNVRKVVGQIDSRLLWGVVKSLNPLLRGSRSGCQYVSAQIIQRLGGLLSLSRLDSEDADDQLKPFLDFDPGPKYTEWLGHVASMLGADVEALKQNDGWYFVYNKGFRPEDAAGLYRKLTQREAK